MDFYKKLITYKAQNNLNYRDLGAIIGKSQDAFRVAIKRESLTDLEKERLLQYFGNEIKAENIEQSKSDRFEDIVAKRVLKAVKPFITETLKSHQENKEALNATMLTVAEANIKLEEMENALKVLEQKINLLTEIDKEVLDRVSGK